MTLNGSGKFLMVGAIAALPVAVPPFLGIAAAQYYYPPPAGEVQVYRVPPDAVGVYPPPDAVPGAVPRVVNVYPPRPDAVDVSPSSRDADSDADEVQPPRYGTVNVRPPHDAADAQSHQASATDVLTQPASGTTTPISAVSMRSGPGTGNPVIGTLHHGDELQLLATANHGWVQVQSSAGTGWVYGSYLASGADVSAATDANAPSPTPISASGPDQSADSDRQPTDLNKQTTSASSQPANGNRQPAPVRRNPWDPEITSP